MAKPKLKTKGPSPKVYVDLFTTVVAFVVTTYAAGLDPVTAAAISKALGTLSGVLAPPGAVERVQG